MKNNLMRAAVFVVLGIALLIVSTFTKNKITETWTSFALGASLPMFIGGIISFVKYYKASKATTTANN
ncbi:MAG TPA: hypothetical protein VL490_06430 [Mucilaginibacter sp.]|jgi:uncharacterized membrane protein|nr:hypothetical protein [Mucilaginibacter sp.]